MSLLKTLSDNNDIRSLANSLRKKRFALFKMLIAQLPRPLHILDLGGTQSFWEHMEFASEVDITFTLLNVVPAEATKPNFSSVYGDARELSQYRDSQFDVVFSNSVIEHVGDFQDQKRMAHEVMRVGKRYFIQTPNYFFPIEPHFLFPGFQFLPHSTRVWLIQHFSLGWVSQAQSKQDAVAIINSVQLLTKLQLKQLFPEANIHAEKVLGLNKSYIAYGGWSTT